MAEGSSTSDSEGLAKQLQTLLSRYSGDQLGADNELFCSDFCKVVEEFASHCQAPLPQLRILDVALCCFSRASTLFTTRCDQVQQVISSLALSIFELLLFFDQKEFCSEPLKQFSITFQECHSVLAKYENVYLLQVERLVRDGGPWASPALEAILSESRIPQHEVERCITSELPVFLELRVRYLLSRGRAAEAMALAKCCVLHLAARQHLFFLQVYLSWLCRTSQHERLHEEVAGVSGKDAVNIVCSLEREETDGVLLALSAAFLSHQLQRGDMFYLCNLVCVWTSLHGRINKSKQALLAECRRLMLSATNIKSIFPFIRAVLQEVGDDGVQFCVELCASALRSGLPCDVITKTCIYKTIAGLLPDDLEVCRACALLVFFSERTVESYKMVYLLYMLPDQEYHVDDSLIGNNVRFETLQVLKKDLYFDPELWNLMALRTNCLKLLSEKVVNAALDEIKEDKWISKYCTKEPALRSCASVCHKGAAAKKRRQEERDAASKRLKMGAGKTRLHDHSLRRKGDQGTRPLKDASSTLRRSFWQLDRIHSGLTLRYEDHKRSTKFSEKNLPKRRIKKPRWLLEDSGALEENVPLKMKKKMLKQKRHLRSCVMKRSQSIQIQNAKHKPSVKTLLKARENKKHQNGFSLDCVKPAPPPKVILELSLPDNELMESFSEDVCNRHRGFPQVLLYKPTVKFPDTSPPSKTAHGKEVILRARDANMLVQQLHCYARRQKGKGNGSSIHVSVSTITRSSVQGIPSRDSQGELCGVPELKAGSAPQSSHVGNDAGSQVPEKVLKDQRTKAGMRKTSSAGERSEKPEKTQTGVEKDTKCPDWPETTEKVLQKTSAEVEGAASLQTLSDAPQPRIIATGGEHFEEPAVEMKVTIASQTPVLDTMSKAPVGEDVSKSQTATCGDADSVLSNCPDVHLEGGEQEFNSVQPLDDGTKNCTEKGVSTIEALQPKAANVPSNDGSPVKNVVHTRKPSETKNDAGERDTSPHKVKEPSLKLSDPDPGVDTRTVSDSSAHKESRDESKPKAGQRTRTSSRCSVSEQDVSVVLKRENKGKANADDIHSDVPEESLETPPETEESHLDHFCTFCNKDFKGPGVVEHAMLHYRKDECTFCRIIFKDDLLAMMHLSDHIEKLKRSKDPPADGKAHKHQVTKDTSTPKTKAKTPSGHQSKGKVKKTAESPECISDEILSGSRALRSSHKSLPDEQNPSKNAKAASHRLNGHIGVKQDFGQRKGSVDEEGSQRKPAKVTNSRLQENQQLETNSSASLQPDKDLNSTEDRKNKESAQNLNQVPKQSMEPVQKKDVEKLRCPVDGCSWFTDLSKNKVTFLYHTLEEHHGDIKPLELAFRVAENKCSICMRVLWSFEHFQHHVERHRLIPRYPCLHRGCTERFKSGIEMRRHTRKHNPLQAMCCLPGCPKLFICLWALNLHEREHYSSKSIKMKKNANAQMADHLCKTPASKSHQTSEDNTEPNAGNGTESRKSTLRLMEQETKVHPVAAITGAKTSKLKQKRKSTELLSEKDISVQPALHRLRLRQTLRKVSKTNTSLDCHKVRQVTSSLKHSSKFKYKLRKMQVSVTKRCSTRRARLLSLKKAALNENHTTGQRTVKLRTSIRLKDEKNKQQAQDEVKSTEKTSSSESEDKHIARTRVTSELRQKPSDGKKVLKRNHHTPSDSSKLKNVKVTKNVVELSKKQTIPPKQPAESKPVPQVEDKAPESSAADQLIMEMDDPDSTQKSVLASALESLNQPLTTKESLEGPLINEEKKGTSLKSGKATTKKKLKKKLEQKFKENPSGKSKGNISALKRSKSDPKGQDKARGAAGILQGLQRLIKSSLDERGKRKEEASHETPNASASSLPTDVIEHACSTDPGQSKPKVKDKCKKSNKSEASKKRKLTSKDDAEKTAKKKCKSRDPTATKKSAKPSSKGHSAGGKADKSPSEKFAIDICSRSLLNNREPTCDDAAFTPSKEVLAEYGKKPHMRLPPTAYLHEKYTTMPKRRKEVLVQHSFVGVPLEPVFVKTVHQRHRCANCFTTFSSAEELQSHVQLQKCSSLFGFDSDDEGKC
uniref:C2H2-type domain-containing protein n=1 Tax=Iconisemion striatum TaxID=60296 RepID=A0A1A7XFJ3_9TELE